MAILDDGTRERTRQALADLPGAVRLVFFERTLDCDTCPEASRLLQEVASLSDKLRFEVFNLVTDAEQARAFKVDRAPALAVVGEKDRGIRFYGTPSGYEFGTLIETIQDVAAGRAGLAAETIESLKGLKAPVHLRVFVTPT